MDSIHKRIKTLRKSKGLSQTALADAAGVSYQSVQEWEREGGTAPRRTRLEKVAKALGVKPIELLTGGIAPVEEQDDLKPPREEILLLLFRGLFSHQQQELIGEMRALFDANQYVRKEMGLKELKGVSNNDVAAAFGSVPPPKPKSRPAKRRNPHKGHPGHPGDTDVE